MNKFKRLYVEVNGAIAIDVNNAEDINIDQYSDYIDFKYKENIENASITKDISIDIENANSITIILKYINIRRC